MRKSWEPSLSCQQQKHQNNIWNVFQVNNKDNRTTSFIVNFEKTQYRKNFTGSLGDIFHENNCN